MIRTYFTTELYHVDIGVDLATNQNNEVASIIYALTPNPSFTPFSLWYSVFYDAWLVSYDDDPFEQYFDVNPDGVISDSFLFFTVNKSSNGSWEINSAVHRQIAHSSTTKFWNTNDTTRTVNYDTLNSLLDKIVILKANVGYDSSGSSILQSNLDYVVLAQELEGYLPDIHKLSVLPDDENGDGISDNIEQIELLNLEVSGSWSDLGGVSDSGSDYIDISQWNRKLNNSNSKGKDLDIKVESDDGSRVERLSYADENLIITSSDLILEKLEFAEIPLGYIRITFIDHVYFTRIDALSVWEPVETTDAIRLAYMSEDETQNEEDLKYDRNPGRYPLNFAWFHQSEHLSLIDPAASNIIDIYIITKGYYTALSQWLENRSDVKPDEPTPLDLRSAYTSMLDNKMISDTVILHPGKFKILFGTRAIPQLQTIFKVIRPETSSMTDNQVKARMVSIIRAFFDIESWNFGEQFFFTELVASIHSDLGPEIDSVVLVPKHSQNQFGDLFQVYSKEDEVFIADISTVDIEVVKSYTSTNLRQNP